MIDIVRNIMESVYVCCVCMMVHNMLRSHVQGPRFDPG